MKEPPKTTPIIDLSQARCQKKREKSIKPASVNELGEIEIKKHKVLSTRTLWYNCFFIYMVIFLLIMLVLSGIMQGVIQE